MEQVAGDQLDGAVALYNMLAMNNVAYLADEVGMGKTYVALGVMALLRHFHPQARVLILAPRQNLQQKWIKEYRNFVRQNWRRVDNRVRSIHDEPAWPPVQSESLLEFAHELLLQADRDFFVRMSSFSMALRDVERRRGVREKIRHLVPWADVPELSAPTYERFRDGVGIALNAALPPFDLVIVDEAHNLKHGFSERVAVRNRILGLALGHRSGAAEGREWFGQRAKRVLMLSATPFEADYSALHKQLEVLGHGDAVLRRPDGSDPLPVSRLEEPDLEPAFAQELVGRLLVRRVSGLWVAGELHTKNMYRREWRAGGYTDHDEPMAMSGVREQLVVGLMQRKLAQVIRDGRFGNSFQIGMLSSFESFRESLGRSRALARRVADSHAQAAEEPSNFDGDQTEEQAERRGIDTTAIADVSDSFRTRFGQGLPHPKLDRTAEALAGAFTTGDKSLVFVRRIRTVDELAAKLEQHADEWLRRRMLKALPTLQNEIEKLFAAYMRTKRGEAADDEVAMGAGGAVGAWAELEEVEAPALEDDAGGGETFFAWFFRGEGPPNYLSGGAFNRNRLMGEGSAYSTLFEDDHVAQLFGYPDDTLDALGKHLGGDRALIREQLRTSAFQYLTGSTRRARGYPRSRVFKAYQQAALDLVASGAGTLAMKAQVMLAQAYETPSRSGEAPPDGFPSPEEFIGITSIPTLLARREGLRAELWPVEEASDFVVAFRRQEQRRYLLSAMCRLGAPYVDLYLCAIQQLGSFALSRGGQQAQKGSPSELAQAFLDLLESQRTQEGFTSWRELHEAASNFDLLLDTNFPGLPNGTLNDAAATIAAQLQKQVPVGRMAGGVNRRLVAQFRMPGFPLVLVTTDVLQEGEDLHTFCRRVIHYGITWTPSAMEQRTGRVDRIGSLVQRELDGAAQAPADDALLQVYFPHLRDTVEVIQIRRVLWRLNRFLALMHHTDKQADDFAPRVDVIREMLLADTPVPAYRKQLQSAFPVAPAWLAPERTVPGSGGRELDLTGLRDHLYGIIAELITLMGSEWSSREVSPGQFDLIRQVGAATSGRPAGRKMGHTMHLTLRSQAAGDATMLRCRVVVDPAMDLSQVDNIDDLYDAQRRAGNARVCVAPPAAKDKWEVAVEQELLFSPKSTQGSEVGWLVQRVEAAVASIWEILNGRGDEGTSTRFDAVRDYDPVWRMVEAAIEAESLPWTREGDAILVERRGDGRTQRVHLSRSSTEYRFWSVIALPSHVKATDAGWNELAIRAWQRNHLKELVCFAFDDDDALVGLIDQPVESLDTEELILYVQTVAHECDRWEYKLTGQDVY